MARTRNRSAWWCVAALAASACTAPALRVETEEHDAALYLDGRFAGHGAVAVPFRYYGTTAVTAVPVRRAVRDDPRLPVRTAVRVDPPAPQWLFPIDFFVEAIRRRFRSAPPVDAVVDLPEPPTPLPLGTRPQHAEELRARAARARTER